MLSSISSFDISLSLAPSRPSFPSSSLSVSPSTRIRFLGLSSTSSFSSLISKTSSLGSSGDDLLWRRSQSTV
jgi:hypothetical protein